MDHIRLPTGSLAHSPIDIPYFGKENDRNNAFAFAEFPERCRIDTDLLKEDKCANLALRDSAPFLQTWLWFGILEKGIVLSPTTTEDAVDEQNTKQLDYRDFLKAKGEQKYLCTVGLHGKIRDLRICFPRHENEHKRQLCGAIQTASVFLYHILNTCSSDRSSIPDCDTNLHDVFDMILAIQILCETLSDAFDVSVFSNSEETHGMKISQETYLAPVNRLLRRSGWCPKEIRRLPHKVTYRYFLSFLRQSPMPLDPSHDGQRECTCVPLDEPFTPAHVDQSCRCENVKVPQDTEEEVSSGKIVLFTYRSHQRTQQSLQRTCIDLSEQSTRFIAVSHVRMQGLGNENQNSLPFCQLTRIQTLVDRLGGNRPGGTCFWIDTLCIPVQRHKRKIALSSVWDIFARAQSTLVWDPPLYMENFANSEEALVRIRYSSWKRRAWTLKEGFVTKNLVFGFFTDMISLKTIEMDLEESYDSEMPNMSIIPNVPRRCITHSTQNNLASMVSTLMRYFEDDIDLWTKDASHTAIYHSPREDKIILYKVMRLGFLSAPEFEYLIEDDERKEIPFVLQCLTRTYGIASTVKPHRSRGSKLESSLKRLKCMLKLLEDENESDNSKIMAAQDFSEEPIPGFEIANLAPAKQRPATDC